MLETVHDEVNRIVYGNITSIRAETLADIGSGNANPAALFDEKHSINLAKFFLFVMLRSHAKAACNDDVRGAVDNQQYANVGCSRHLWRPGSYIFS